MIGSERYHHAGGTADRLDIKSMLALSHKMVKDNGWLIYLMNAAQIHQNWSRV